MAARYLKRQIVRVGTVGALAVSGTGIGALTAEPAEASVEAYWWISWPCDFDFYEVEATGGVWVDWANSMAGRSVFFHPCWPTTIEQYQVRFWGRFNLNGAAKDYSIYSAHHEGWTLTPVWVDYDYNCGGGNCPHWNPSHAGSEWKESNVWSQRYPSVVLSV